MTEHYKLYREATILEPLHSELMEAMKVNDSVNRLLSPTLKKATSTNETAWKIGSYTMRRSDSICKIRIWGWVIQEEAGWSFSRRWRSRCKGERRWNQNGRCSWGALQRAKTEITSRRTSEIDLRRRTEGKRRVASCTWWNSLFWRQVYDVIRWIA